MSIRRRDVLIRLASISLYTSGPELAFVLEITADRCPLSKMTVTFRWYRGANKIVSIEYAFPSCPYRMTWIVRAILLTSQRTKQNNGLCSGDTYAWAVHLHHRTEGLSPLQCGSSFYVLHHVRTLQQALSRSLPTSERAVDGSRCMNSPSIACEVAHFIYLHCLLRILRSRDTLEDSFDSQRHLLRMISSVLQGPHHDPQVRHSTVLPGGVELAFFIHAPDRLDPARDFFTNDRAHRSDRVGESRCKYDQVILNLIAIVEHDSVLGESVGQILSSV